MQELKRVLIIGSGPIVIGQACEFDYSGTQACKALMEKGLEVILVNSNPATIMTDPEVATKVYIEPLTVPFLEKIISAEKPDAIIPTLGGQTALNLAMALHGAGVLQRHGVRLLGATPEVIRSGEDRELFRGILDRIGAKYPKSMMVRTFDQGLIAAEQLGLPLILRPNFTLGGGGGGIAYSQEEYVSMIVKALQESPTSEVLVEESILGWKEFELEVMRDRTGTFVVICTIENFDPCGVHTGDSITVAPQQTLSDREYQNMRDEACRILNEVGVETGGANIQFAVCPKTGERVVIEMNPRVSRSSALASKATGFPIAKIAALLAIGYRLDEITNDITKVTPSCYEPALDYVVTKVPRFAFEKFSGVKDNLTTQMKSVGEVMAIGRDFQESLLKALSALEKSPEAIPDVAFQLEKVSHPNSERIYHLIQAFRNQEPLEKISEITQINPWFLEQIQEVVEMERELSSRAHDFGAAGRVDSGLLLRAKRKGLTDARIGKLVEKTEDQIRKLRWEHDIRPVFLQVDTCAGEFESKTPYFYSTYWSRESVPLSLMQAVAVIGSGPNRIGQGIEFDYSCVRGVRAARNFGHKVAMLNSNPETVSTDYDASDILFFEPLTSEHLLEVFYYLKPYGFVAQLGGQTPINLSEEIVKNGYKLLGSSVQAIALAEDRGLFAGICRSLGIQIPQAAMAADFQQALEEEEAIGYPMICRPSYVLGGRRMEVVENREELESYFTRNQEIFSPESPCLIDQFLFGALEVDVDLVRGKDWVVIGGIVEHIEAAGVHSGDSMGVLPPQRLRSDTMKKIEELSAQLAERMQIVGHLNLQIAVKNDRIFLIEANPRSSRSVPFISKASGIPLVDLGMAAMLGYSKQQLMLTQKIWSDTKGIAVKGVVFPFRKFPEADIVLGPEMKSTGESMGIGETYAEALMKAFLSSNHKLVRSGEVLFSVRDKDKNMMLGLARELRKMGFSLSATTGTAAFFAQNGVECLSLRKVHEGRPHCVDHIRSGQVSLVINTTSGRLSLAASYDIRRACLDYGVPCLTESDTAEAFVLALKDSLRDTFSVRPIGSYGGMFRCPDQIV